MKVTRLFGYCRVSTQRQAERGYSLDDQERRIRSYVDTYYDDGCYTLDIFRDEGRSGKNLDRPMMKKMIAEAKKNKVDVIIFYCLNRLTRSVKDTIFLLELVDSCDIEFVSISENLDTSTAMGRYFITTLAALAQLEREQDGERSKRGIIEGAKQGNYVRPRAPFGYYRDPQTNKTLLIDEKKAELVRCIFKTLAEEDVSVNNLANKLHVEGHFGLKWNERSVYRLVNNKIYYGCLEIHGNKYENIVPPIITKELFDEVQEKLNGTKKTAKHDYIFKNYIRCSKCKKLCKVAAGTGWNGTVYKYYRCKDCRRQISEKKVLKEVSKELNQFLQQNYYQENLNRLMNKHKSVKTQLANLTYAFVRYDLNKEEYNKMMKSMADEKKTIEEDIERIKSGLIKIDFEKFCISKQHDIIRKYIKYIDVDFKSGSVFIIYRDVTTS